MLQKMLVFKVCVCVSYIPAGFQFERESYTRSTAVSCRAQGYLFSLTE